MITIAALIERGYIEPSTSNRWPILSAYQWTGLGQVNCAIWMPPEDYVKHVNAGTVRHCVHCYRSMMYKPASEKDPTQSWRVVCRGCFAEGKRLDTPAEHEVTP